MRHLLVRLVRATAFRRTRRTGVVESEIIERESRGSGQHQRPMPQTSIQPQDRVRRGWRQALLYRAYRSNILMAAVECEREMTPRRQSTRVLAGRPRPPRGATVVPE